MKNFFKILGLVAIVAIIGFSMAACNSGSTTGGAPEAVTYSGATSNGDLYSLEVFNNTTYEFTWTNGNTTKTSSGTVKGVNGYEFILLPSNAAPNETFNAIVTNDGLSAVNGVLTWTDGTTKTMSGTLTPVVPSPNSSASGNTSASSNTSGGTLTVNGIPSTYNGKYAYFVAIDDSEDVVIGSQSINETTGDFTYVKISNGSVNLPVWHIENGQVVRYSGSKSFSLNVLYILNNATDGLEDYIDACLYQAPITFSKGTATVSGGLTCINTGSETLLSSSGTAYVSIGTQVWMAENLNYDVSGSRCHKDDPANCAKYGRLYDWATAMALPSSCNSASCSGQILPKHRGICPQGWHIPSNEDWDKLFHYVDGSSGASSPYDSPTAGRYLKAKSGWNDNGNGEDKYGFSALPSGQFSSGVGCYGDWWSASEFVVGGAYLRSMTCLDDEAFFSINGKSTLYGVRCLQD